MREKSWTKRHLQGWQAGPIYGRGRPAEGTWRSCINERERLIWFSFFFSCFSHRARGMMRSHLPNKFSFSQAQRGGAPKIKPRNHAVCGETHNALIPCLSQRLPAAPYMMARIYPPPARAVRRRPRRAAQAGHASVVHVRRRRLACEPPHRRAEGGAQRQPG
jgi:hypothetical protein